MRRLASEILKDLELRVAHLESGFQGELRKSIEVVIENTPSNIRIDRVEFPRTQEEFLEIEANNVPVIFYNCPLGTNMVNRLELFKSDFNPMVESRLADRNKKDIGELLEINLQDLLRSNFERGSRYVGKHRLNTRALKKLLGVNLYGKGQILEGMGINSANMWCGPKGCVTPLHLDTINNLAWNVYGQKTWFLVSPEDMYHKAYLEPFKEPYEEDYKGDWTRNDGGRSPTFSKMTENPLKSFNQFPMSRGIKFHKVVFRENEMLYLPAYWGHYVNTDSDSLMINHWYDEVPIILSSTRVKGNL